MEYIDHLFIPWSVQIKVCLTSFVMLLNFKWMRFHRLVTSLNNQGSIFAGTQIRKGHMDYGFTVQIIMYAGVIFR